MVLPDDIKDLLRRDLPKKPLGELLQDLQRDLPEALDNFLSTEDPERKRWIESKLILDTSESEPSETEESDSHAENASWLPELHWLTKVLRYKPASSEEHEKWAKQIEAGLFAQERLDTEVSLLDAKSRKDLERVVEIGINSNELFILHNLRLVWSIARKSSQILSTEEHFQNGIFGLIRGIEGWDWRQGFQFSTYASWWIRQSISRAMSDTAHTIRIPVHILEKISSASKEANNSEFKENNPQFDSSNDGDKDINTSGTKSLTNPIVMAKNAIDRSYSYEMIVDKYDFLLEYQVNTFEDTTFDYALQSTFNYHLNLVLASLTKREETVIKIRYGLMDGEAKTLEEIGLIFGLTRERIRQIESKSIAKLRHPSRSEGLKDYLDPTFSGE